MSNKILFISDYLLTVARGVVVLTAKYNNTEMKLIEYTRNLLVLGDVVTLVVA